ncbi:MAG: glycoside hydrolase family 2 TIM barrel-domain containing protein [Bacteroidales bacterium]|nr:glycoside hydrolase family 2 TIM barrel-domain containing protein [Bacteroidales bacterium]
MIHTKNLSLCLAALSLVGCATEQQGRQEQQLSHGWQFSRDSAQWEEVAIPHDWAIAGPFDKKWDLQTVAIEQNGETEATEKSGRSGALPWIGKGYYRTKINLARNTADARLIFDGAMSEPVVYVNGQVVGRWGYGYNAFEVDLTPYACMGGETEIVVALNNREESSRWYPGAGLYRPVTLVTTGKMRIDEWKTFLRTKSIDGGVSTLLFDGHADGLGEGENASMVVELRDADGHFVSSVDLRIDSCGNAKGTLDVSNPKLWTPETPNLYTAKVSLVVGGLSVDEVSFKTGVRTVAVERESGFLLNGKARKIKGVCLHHDLGPLGAAENRAAFERQVRIMKEMGADAIRTAHNMPSRMQMEVCDSMGMMVMAESFDMWIYPKCKNGYARLFKEWSDRDITNLVCRHRNHPSIIMWSIGNEIPEQGMVEGPENLTRLQDLCHSLDETRPVTQGMDRIEWAIKNNFAQLQDVVGMNYRVHLYEPNIDKLPQGIILGSETASTISSRGVYKYPVEVVADKAYNDGQCSSYDTEYCSWSNIPDDDFAAQDDLPYTIGQFVWTGFDYLGEPTPYDTYWPSRSSYFGICDLAGLPKDRYYLYRSIWNTESHTTHLLPHWTWTGRNGEVTPVYCYTDAPSAELFVNGKSQGKRTKEKDSKLDRYRLRWNDVKYEPGEIAVVAYDADGNETGRDTVRTAGAPAALRLTADKPVLSAKQADMAFVTVEMVDERGTLVPNASDTLVVEVSGAGQFKAACNGDATSLTPFVSNKMELFSGMMVAVVSSNGKVGDIKVRISEPKSGMSKELTLTAK